MCASVRLKVLFCVVWFVVAGQKAHRLKEGSAGQACVVVCFVRVTTDPEYIRAVDAQL